MTDFALVTLRAVVVCSDRRVDDVEADAYEQLRQTMPDLGADVFADQVAGLLDSGYLTKARPKRDGAGEIVRARYLRPTTKGRIAVTT